VTFRVFRGKKKTHTHNEISLYGVADSRVLTRRFPCTPMRIPLYPLFDSPCGQSRRHAAGSEIPPYHLGANQGNRAAVTGCPPYHWARIAARSENAILTRFVLYNLTLAMYVAIIVRVSWNQFLHRHDDRIHNERQDPKGAFRSGDTPDSRRMAEIHAE